MVRSFSHKLAFSIRKISMNRKPRPSAGKYTIGRSSPAVRQRSRRGAASGTSSTSSREHHRLRQHGEIDQRADLGLRQDLQPLQDRIELIQPQHGIEERSVQRDRRQVERRSRWRRRHPPAPRRASSAMESSGPSEVTSPLANEPPAGRCRCRRARPPGRCRDTTTHRTNARRRTSAPRRCVRRPRARLDSRMRTLQAER